MSKTFKDEPWQIRFEKTGLKVKKKIDSKWHWVESSPSWWNNLFHTKPKRVRVRNWIQGVKNGNVDPDNSVCPDHGNKPHHYYW